MNPFKTLVTALATFAADFRAKMNPALEALPKLESIEAADPVLNVLRMVKWAQKDAEEMAASFDGKLENVEKMLADYTAKVSESAVAEAITAKKVVPFEDHENAITSAKETAAKEAKDTAETEFNAKLQKIETLAARRKDAVTRIGELAAASLTDDVLAGDKHEEAITAIEGRIAKLKENHITAEGRPKMFSDLLAKADEAAFTAGLEIILEAAGGQLAAVAATPPPAPKVDAKDGKTPLAAGERKKAIC